MKRIIYFLILFSCGRIYGQLLPIDPAIEIQAGYRMTQEGFYNQLNSFNQFSFKKPIQLVGIGITDHAAVGPGQAFRKIMFNTILPQNILLQDTVHATVKGFIASASAGRNIFRKSKYNDLFVGLGINVGRIRLYHHGLLDKYSLLITPKLIIKPIFFFKQFYADLTFEYDFDFNHPGWSNNGLNKLNDLSIKNFNHTSLTAALGIGCFLNKR